MTRAARSIIHRASVAGGLIFAVYCVALGAPASAAEGDGESPALESQWYFTEPAVGYSSAPPYGRIDESLMGEGLKAVYFLPEGGAPARGQGDIGIALWLDQSTPSNEARIDLGAFQNLEADLQTNFVDGLALPLADGSPNPLDVQFSGSVLTVTRPDEGCGRTDRNSPYKSQVALLGANGFKYLVDLDLDLGRRPPCSEEEAKPTAPPAATKVKTTEIATGDVTEAVVGDKQDGNWLPIVAAGALLALLLLGVKLIKSPRRAFKADGTLASSEKSGAPFRDKPASVVSTANDDEPEAS